MKENSSPVKAIKQKLKKEKKPVNPNGKHIYVDGRSK